MEIELHVYAEQITHQVLRSCYTEVLGCKCGTKYLPFWIGHYVLLVVDVIPESAHISLMLVFRQDQEDKLPIFREVKAAIKSLKARKGPRIDSIPGEILKSRGEQVVDVLLKLCHQSIWDEEEAF
ncbi:hypothetical protein CAPTEDRAFT_210495 [Capitella teleta]|uniref:Uncharacterized protein n=1 Tax=Capitella teleta TaxID=283909 RepID=R7VEF9_CAPTE|nr:hypothetical protein CAPTEDRAFT_210495 [Capitella teleta]|eukprot:ELU17208.1 hypothetical protein CAPTEDRAFT_210495 [Capitella teleta]